MFIFFIFFLMRGGEWRPATGIKSQQENIFFFFFYVLINQFLRSSWFGFCARVDCCAFAGLVFCFRAVRKASSSFFHFFERYATPMANASIGSKRSLLFEYFRIISIFHLNPKISSLLCENALSIVDCVHFLFSMRFRDEDDGAFNSSGIFSLL